MERRRIRLVFSILLLASIVPSVVVADEVDPGKEYLRQLDQAVTKLEGEGGRGGYRKTLLDATADLERLNAELDLAVKSLLSPEELVADGVAMSRPYLLLKELFRKLQSLSAADDAAVKATAAAKKLYPAILDLQDRLNDLARARSVEAPPLATAAQARVNRFQVLSNEAEEVSKRTLDVVNGAWDRIEAIAAAVHVRRLRSKESRAQSLKVQEVAGNCEGLVYSIRGRHPGWFRNERLAMLLYVFLLSFFILYYIRRAQRGEKLFIRRIAGLSALDDAVGRATEMGKPVIFVSGIMDVDEIQTLAGLNILGYVAKKTAEYDTDLWVPCCRSMVLSTAQEVVRESYTSAGRPDAYNPDKIIYLTEDQFGFVAGVSGMMVREKPAATFYLGCFYAESLLLAEAGNSVGAIQIAGTAMPSQLPFFVAACDYTLIGEELFAASAYLSGEPKLLGSLKGQDVGKGLVIASLIVGCILETLIVFGLLAPGWSLVRFFTIQTG